MAELPFHLKTLESLPGALDILRMLGQTDDSTADADEICDELGLSDRRFSKAIRRLVTKGYVVMDGDMVYRLSEQGEDAVDELADYDAESDNEPDTEPAPVRSADHIARRLVLALPQTVTANQPANVVVGFDPAQANNQIPQPADLLLRFSVVNGEPATADDTLMKLTNDTTYETFQVVPGAYTQVRLKVEVMQLDNFSGDIAKVGGLYVDVDVSGTPTDAPVIAYGANVNIAP